MIATLALACMSTLALARSPDADPATKLAELRETRSAAMAEWEKALQGAKDQTEGMKIWQARPGREFIPELKAIAVEAKGTDTAREAWFDVLDIAGDIREADDARLAIDTTVKEFVTSPELGPFASLVGQAAGLVGMDTATKALETLVEKSPHAAVKAPALFSLGSLLAESDKPEQKAAGHKALDRLVSEFPDVKPKRGATYAERAKGILFELDHLQVGMVAPNFESIDENGQKLAVADYKGKVIVLDFWGNW